MYICRSAGEEEGEEAEEGGGECRPFTKSVALGLGLGIEWGEWVAFLKFGLQTSQGSIQMCGIDFDAKYFTKAHLLWPVFKSQGRWLYIAKLQFDISNENNKEKGQQTNRKDQIGMHDQGILI